MTRTFCDYCGMEQTVQSYQLTPRVHPVELCMACRMQMLGVLDAWWDKRPIAASLPENFVTRPASHAVNRSNINTKT